MCPCSRGIDIVHVGSLPWLTETSAWSKSITNVISYTCASSDVINPSVCSEKGVL